MQRIEAYLEEEEVPDWACSLKASKTNDDTTLSIVENRIGFENGTTFEWDKSANSTQTEVTSSRFRLVDLDISFPVGKLSLVAGRTGSGKTALLSALLGELHCITGKVHIDKRDHHIAYCGQAPWLEHATIKENILYGCSYDQDRYEQVLDVCALERDLLILPAGDQTEIGEKGVTLSGGQRARIALARAVYSRAECLLLDDPLAAVDMHTANHIYDLCISGDLLKGRTVILVTHHIALCATNASYLVELSNGYISHQGTIEDLRAAGHLGHIAEEQSRPSVERSSSTAISTPVNEADGVDVKEKGTKTPKEPNGKLVHAEARREGRLFRAMLFRLCRAPIRFFDVTPLGRVLNRFVTDFGTIDGALNDSVRRTLAGILTFVSSFGVIVVLVPSFLPAALFIAYLYVRLAPAFILASRDLRRLELTSLSPTFASFDELLHGLAHVRAFAMEARYQDQFYKKVDRFQSYDHVYWLLAIWMRWRYDCLGSVVVFCATLFTLWAGVESGYAAVIIVQAGVFAEASRQLIKVTAQLELDFNSVDRVAEYLDVPEEAPLIIPDRRPPAYWPSNTGGLSVENLVMRYADDLPPVLKDLSFDIKPSEKIAVVGRTGSGRLRGLAILGCGIDRSPIGKSTLALSLLRMIEPVGGRIVLDGLDIGTMGLEDLRTRIQTIVSQDVSLFSGSIRSNLDPFDEHDDQECWDVLKRCHLVGGSEGNGRITSLDTQISQRGSLSAGERQLVALARAVLRRSQVVIMDEATSAIDLQLDEMVQRTIREELSEALVITIAHRLRTIIDYDRVMVLGSEGRILEFDEPGKLLANPEGVFTEMCRQSADWEELKATVTSKSR
ncbi:hypothetical protein M422DRAFT_52742 [Sphaerobolus stellatus SS14]|uniref:ATP-dependent bile acid permease n=1 Tax=Sphaerobolus stellatus (strain SS14) TaxID=990650 RepID=A0A0C9UTW8_SPHS4|nr:hypothetical protein M422DRAFT_52742 [Sphaerobolus stellatus SS14]